MFAKIISIVSVLIVFSFVALAEADIDQWQDVDKTYNDLVEEGFEVNVAGLTFGIDPMDFALKLPGLGRVGRHSSVNE